MQSLLRGEQDTVASLIQPKTDTGMSSECEVFYHHEKQLKSLKYFCQRQGKMINYFGSMKEVGNVVFVALIDSTGNWRK